MLNGLLAAGGSLLGAGLSYFGQSQANKANQEQAREQMRFQENLSGTAYQRARADMIKAGLNPLLLANGSPAASSPSGASSVSSNAFANSGTDLSNSAKAVSLEGQLLKSNIDLNKAAAIREMANAELAQTSARLTSLDIPVKQAESQIYDSEIAKKILGISKVAGQAVGNVAGGAHSALNAFRTYRDIVSHKLFGR